MSHTPQHTLHLKIECKIPFRKRQHEPVHHAEAIHEQTISQVALRDHFDIGTFTGALIWVTVISQIRIWSDGIENELGARMSGKVIVGIS